MVSSKLRADRNSAYPWPPLLGVALTNVIRQIRCRTNPGYDGAIVVPAPRRAGRISKRCTRLSPGRLHRGISLHVNVHLLGGRVHEIGNLKLTGVPFNNAHRSPLGRTRT